MSTSKIGIQMSRRASIISFGEFVKLFMLFQSESSCKFIFYLLRAFGSQQDAGLPTLTSGMVFEDGEDREEAGAGMNLSFEPMLMTFTDICYFVDMPAVGRPIPETSLA